MIASNSAWVMAPESSSRFAVSISDADRSPLLEYTATVHHGIDMSEFAPTDRAGDDLVVFGRIHPDKGIADAIEIAIGQGAKPGTGGMLLGMKISEKVAHMRSLPVGVHWAMGCRGSRPSVSE